MIVKREKSAERFNQIVNHPEVIEWVRGYVEGPLDMTMALHDERNILLMGEHGGILFTWTQPGIYEAHVQVLPGGRGAWTLRMVQECLKWMFTKTEAVEIVTRVPKGNLAARALVRLIHGTFEFRNPNGWVINKKPVYADIFALRIQDWMRTAPGMVSRGEWFHDKLEKEFKRMKFKEPPHPEDEVHDRYVGVATEMILGGQPHKAMIFYNRWASLAGYKPIEIVTERPLLLNIQTALIMVRNDNFWVVSCQQG